MNDFIFSSLAPVEVIVAGIAACLVPTRCRPVLLAAVLLVAVLIATYGFFAESGGQPIFADDHPSFLYRLSQLVEFFPNIPFYNPLWNGGVEAREFFPSGVLNLFLLSAPLLYLLPVEAVYNGLVIGLLCVFAPVMMVGAARYLGLRPVGLLVAALLTLSCSLMWYRWALTYGTMGFCVSAALAPLVTLLAARSLEPDVKRHRSERILLGVGVTCMVLWPLAAVVLVPLGVVFLIRLRRLFAVPSFRNMVLCLIVVNVPWVVIFLDASNVFSFVSSAADTHGQAAKKLVGASHASFAKGLIVNSAALNPVLLLLALPGLRAVSAAPSGALYALTCVWTLILGLFGPYIVPQLELERFLVILALLLPLPVASYLESYLCCTPSGITRDSMTATIRRGRAFAARSAVITALLLVPALLWRIVHHKTVVRYHFADPIVQQLSSTIRNLEGDARVLFSGFVLHELSGGHLAPLPYLTQRALMASRYQHDRWQYTDSIPLEYRQRKDEGVREYLSLMNVSHVVAHEKFWQAWFSERPAEYRLLEKHGRFWVFIRLGYTPSYFHRGDGKLISQDGGSIVVAPATASVVLKFNYYRYLTSSDCVVAPFVISPEVTLIEIRECSSKNPVVLTARGPLDRLRSEYF